MSSVALFADLTTRRVIIGVLGMLFILPLFEIEGGYYGQLTAFDTAGVKILHDVACATGPDSEAVEKSIEVLDISQNCCVLKIHLGVCWKCALFTRK